MYKNLVSFLIFVLTLSSFSQTNLSTNGIRGNSRSAASLFSGFKVVNYGQGSFENGAKIEGSPYLFKSWSNKSKVWYGKNVFDLDSMNYNVKYERFEFKLNKDSIFIINPDNDVKKVEIGIFQFKPYLDYESNSYSFYGVLWEDANYSLLSKYKLMIKGGSIDPLTKSYITSKEYVSEKDYFVLRHKGEEKMVAIRLKKSDILKLIDDSHIDKVKSFVKMQKLKYDNVTDVQKILTYYYSNKS